jgi:diadenosine tetraphosphate (Ap4A) HIT family hydrolase
VTACPLCVPPQSETSFWRDARCRIVHAGDPDYPGYCRVVWNEHRREMSDLAADERERLMANVYTVEASLRMLLQPIKVNLASLGNQVPHLHWHVIPRFPDDPHYPDAIWASRRRAGTKPHFEANALREELIRRLGPSL